MLLQISQRMLGSISTALECHDIIAYIAQLDTQVAHPSYC